MSFVLSAEVVATDVASVARMDRELRRMLDGYLAP
jgi:hypothetical protein